MKTPLVKRDGRWAHAMTALTLLCLVSAPAPAAAAPTRADLIGEITELTLDDPSDPYSGGTLVVGGERVVLPQNLLVDLPANMLSLTDLFLHAPPGCAPASGLARNDACLAGRPGAIATVLANRTNGGNVIAGDVKIAKGTELLTGVVSFIDYQSGFFRINAAPGSPTGGLMVRLNDPSARHSIQSGLGCAGGPGAGPNCSPDVRFTGDPDNYTVGFATGYPACLPSTVATALRPTPANAAGVGDAFCPATNRTGTTAANATRFAPLLVGDSVTITGNREVVNGVELISAWSLLVNAAVFTLNTSSQPDYLKVEQVTWDAPGFNNNRARLVMIGESTLSNAAVDIFSIHRDPTDNSAHQVPLGSTVNNNAPVGIGVNAGFIFRVRYDVDFVQGAKPGLSPCGNLAIASGPTATPGFNTCAGLGFGAGIAAELSVISPNARELVMRSRHHATLNAGVRSFDVSGNVAPDGVYLTPVSPDYPAFIEIDVARVATPFNFEGIPWLADRRLSPAGCAGGCEPTPQPLTPFPFSGLDPTNQVAVPAPARVLAFWPFASGQEAPFPPVDPAPMSIAPVTPAASVCSVAQPAPSITSVTPASALQGGSGTIALTGSGLVPGAICSFGAGINASCTVLSPTSAMAVIAVTPTATPGPRDIVLTNPNNLVATLPNGFSVTAAPPPPPPGAAAPIALLIASTGTVQPGGSSTLTFATANATAVTIAPIGSFGASGTVVVSPSVTTTYVLTATGPGGSAMSSVMVTVAGAPGGPLFADTFTRSGALGASWTVVKGDFTLDGTGATASVAGRNEAVAAGLSVTDARVKVVVTLPVNGSVGANLRRSVAASSGYAVRALSSGIVLIQKTSGGVAGVLQSVAAGVAAGQSHTLTMKVTGASPVVIQVDLDGSPLMTVNDASATRITAPGTVSIEGILGSRWDDIQVF